MELLFVKVVLLVALVTWLIAMLIAYQYGRIGRQFLRIEKKQTAADVELPPLSVVIAAHNQAPALRRYLPEILNQDFERFEVIVVDMRSTDETKDILERLELQYAHLRHTFVPASARDISLQRLALTLGIRSAANEWVVITRPDCRPASPLWLRRIAETIVQPTLSIQSPSLKKPDMLLGFTRYDEQRSTLLDRKAGFYRLWNSIANINHILGGHAAVRADACNIAYRKSFFLEHGGFTALDLTAGAEELLVNHNSTPANTALLLSPSAFVIQDPIGEQRRWQQQLVFYAETRRHQRHAHLYRFMQGSRILWPWLMLLLVAVPFVASIVMLSVEPHGVTIILASVLALLLISYLFVKVQAFHKTARALDCQSYTPTFLIYELALLLWNTNARIARRFASRNEFRKKFV